MTGAGLAHPVRRPDIDGLRAVAVACVILFHAFPEAVRWGFIGVDIFFVISGYLITTILLENLARGSFSFTEFYARRIRRIFPALIAVLAATYAGGLYFLLPQEMASLGAHVAAGGGFVANLLLWAETGYFDWNAFTKPLLHLWSLGVEEQFYIAWPLVLWLLRRRPRALAIACFAFPLASFAWGCVQVGQDRMAAFYSPLARIWEILAGGTLAWIALHRAAWLGRHGNVQGVAAIAALAAAAAFIDDDRLFPGAWALLPVACAAFIISAGPRAWLNARVLSHPVLVGIGLVSYPLYLWHWPLLVYARLSSGPELEPATVAAILCASLVLAWATYRWIEAPLRFGRHRGAKAWGLVVAMAAVIGAGLFARAEHGFPARTPPLVRALLDAPFDFRVAWRDSTCFLDPEQDRTAFDRCPDTYAPPTLLLWGDSQAAATYPGIAERFGKRYHVVQRTASACPPLLDTDIALRAHCRGINERVIEEIERYRPEVVVLVARWGKPGYYRFDGLHRAIARAKAAGVRRIVLVGPIPIWKQRLPRQLFLGYRHDPAHEIPSRLPDGVASIHTAVEPAIEAIARQYAIDYVSPVRALCDPAGCLARVGDDAEGVLYWDESHFTPAGSRWFAARLPIPDDPAALR